MAFELRTDQQVTLTVEARDAAGVVIADPGTRTWSSSDEAVLTVTAPDAAGVVTVVPVSAGTATVTVTDVEPEGTTFVGSLAFIVSAPADPVVQITIVAGTPTPKA